MARPRKATVDPFTDLQQKAAVLECEMARQRAAMDKLKQMAAATPHPRHTPAGEPNQRLSR
jgi:hypothetical protein